MTGSLSKQQLAALKRQNGSPCSNDALFKLVERIKKLAEGSPVSPIAEFAVGRRRNHYRNFAHKSRRMVIQDGTADAAPSPSVGHAAKKSMALKPHCGSSTPRSLGIRQARR